MRYDIDDERVTRTQTVRGHEHREHRSTPQMLAALLDHGLYSTLDLYPTGVVSVRRGGGYEQIVLVDEPRIDTVHHYGGTYDVAYPYRVIAGEWGPHGFIGARMFFSPVPILGLEQPLYHATLPNVNCLGYGGTAVGWVCLYHGRNVEKSASVSDRASMLGLRCSGMEGYNGNMASIDGPVIQRREGRPNYTHDPKAWEAKTAKEGLDWVRDPKIWVPILVRGIDSQTEHHQGGTPLTVEMMMTGTAPWYYNDAAVRPYNVIARGKTLDTKMLDDMVGLAFAKAAKVAAPPEPETVTGDAELSHELPAELRPPVPDHPVCGFCGNNLLGDGYPAPAFGRVCPHCIMNTPFQGCANCGQFWLENHMHWSDEHDNWYCNNCA